MREFQTCAAYAVSAPTGLWNVATGGAARPCCGPTRNPWKANEERVSHSFFLFAPEGRRRFVEQRKDIYARRSPDDAMNFTFTGFPAVRGPRPTAWAATQGRPYDGTTA
jgi:hypothetical protein